MRKILILWFFTFCNLTSAQIINFPDANFKNALVKTLCVDTDYDDIGDADADFNDDGDVDVSEASKVKGLYVSFTSIRSLVGIEKFINLTWLSCSANQLTSLDLKGLIKLKTLDCISNQLTSLDVHGLINLETLDCHSNQLTSLDLRGLINLKTIYCYYNKMTSLNVQGLIKLETLHSAFNHLTSLDLKGIINLKFLICVNNQLTSLDLQGLLNLDYLNCRYNQLTSLDVKNTKIVDQIYFENNPNLKYICCNEERIEGIKNMAIANGQNCEVDSECSVTNTQDLYTNINTYPNPVSDILYLDTNENWTKAEIFDIARRVMRSVNLHSSSMDVSDLQSGTYFIRLKDGERVGLVKFVKI